MTEAPRLDLGHRLPMIMAAEAAECGLACIGMVAGYHGRHETLASLRQQCRLSLSGARLRDLMVFADGLGLSNRALRIEVNDLRHLICPAILHWDLNHYVVLRATSRKGVRIHDPAAGVRFVPWDEVARRFSGAALELARAPSFEQKKAVRPISLLALLPPLSGLKRSALYVLTLSVALQLTTLAAPLQLQFIVDQTLATGDATILPVVALAFAAILLLNVVCEGLRNWTLQVLGTSLSFQLVGRIVRHLLRLPASFFEKRHVGDLLSRISSVKAVQDFLTRGLVSAVLDGIMGMTAAAVMIIYSPLLAFVAIAAAALNLAIAWVFFSPMRRLTEEQLQAGASEQSHLMETIRSAALIKVMGGEIQRESAWRNLFAGSLARAQGVVQFQAWSTALQALVSGGQLILVLFLGARLVLEGAGFSVGMLMAFLAFRQIFADRLNALITTFIQVKMLGLHLHRLGDVLQTPIEWDGREGATEIADVDRLEMSSATFRYSDAEPEILSGVNLTVAPGDFIAIVGPTGSGKTTLLKLLLGLNEPTEGSVCIGGRAATPALWRKWREQVGVVGQDDHPLVGTIAENIAFFDPHIDMDAVVTAATLAGFHDDVLRRPMQYRTLLAEGGANISGGQRQRLLLARALYRRPNVLILDEGTANLDLETEAQIVELVSNLPITRIVVAHRPALVNHAQAVYKLEQGRLHRCSGTGPPFSQSDPKIVETADA